MSVLIKGMRMPTGNDELRLIIHSNGQVIISHKTYYEEAEAVHIPPHGRLIDADALKELYDLGEELDYCHVTLPVIRQNIDDMPTIIEAEEET